MSKSKNMRDHASELADRIAPHVENVRDKAGPMITEAREKAAPVIADAKEKAAPMIADAREKAGPVLSDARSKLTNEVLPVITAAVAAASEATEDVRAEAKKRGAATAAALKGEIEAPKKKSKHRLRTFLVVLGLGGIAAAIAKKLSDREATTAWQSSYQPTPATPTPAPAPAAAAPASDETPTATAAAAAAAADEGGSAPDEAAADAAEHPHAATTPDQPAEEVNLENK